VGAFTEQRDYLGCDANRIKGNKMLKTVSSVVNALGALNYQGTWNASTNTPALASGVGTQGDYYVVSVAGTTNLDGITNWGPGDWAAFNGSIWQRIEGGADGNFVDLDVTGTGTIGNMTLSGSTIDVDPDGTSGYTQSRLILEASGIASRGAGTFTHNDVSDIEWFQGMAYDSSGSWAACSQSTAAHNDSTANFSNAKFSVAAAGDATVHSGNLVIGTSGKGIDFSATAGTGTSELLDDYEEGVFIATLAPATSGTITLVSTANELAYTKVGRQVFINGMVIVDSVSSPVGGSVKLNLPFTSANLGDAAGRSTGVSTQNTSGAYLLTPIYSFEAAVEAEIIFDASTVTAAHRFYFSLSYITA
jgi:hypothetical protein